MSSFTSKQRDSGPIILSHFYLLIGCALPLWVCSIININHWAAFSGIISIGIGDSVVFFKSNKLGINYWSIHWQKYVARAIKNY
jgi:dolichol kinase